VPALPPPPSTITGPIGDWLQILWKTVYQMPNMSNFSAATPNGVVSGVPGDLAVNLTSASSDIRLYQKGGSARVPSTTGWNPV